MEKFLEKVASVLDKAADHIEKYESRELETQEKIAEEKKKEVETQREKILNPIREKLSSVADSSEIDEKLKNTPIETLELISRSLGKTAGEDSDANEDWGKIEESSQRQSYKSAGELDPIAAFALGD